MPSERVRLALVGLEPAGSDRGYVGIEIVEEDRHHRAARAIGVLRDVDRPVLGKRPHCLSGMREEGPLAEQPLLPRSGRFEVTHAQTREEVQRHRGESRSCRYKVARARSANSTGCQDLGRGTGHSDIDVVDGADARCRDEAGGGSEGSALISRRAQQQNHAWFSCTTPFLTGDFSTYPASPARHFCAFRPPLRPFALDGYLAPL
jgi:hypothetical protein